MHVENLQLTTQLFDASQMRKSKSFLSLRNFFFPFVKLVEGILLLHNGWKLCRRRETMHSAFYFLFLHAHEKKMHSAPSFAINFATFVETFVFSSIQSISRRQRTEKTLNPFLCLFSCSLRRAQRPQSLKQAGNRKLLPENETKTNIQTHGRCSMEKFFPASD